MFFSLLSPLSGVLTPVIIVNVISVRVFAGQNVATDWSGQEVEEDQEEMQLQLQWQAGPQQVLHWAGEQRPPVCVWYSHSCPGRRDPPKGGQEGEEGARGGEVPHGGKQGRRKVPRAEGEDRSVELWAEEEKIHGQSVGVSDAHTPAAPHHREGREGGQEAELQRRARGRRSVRGGLGPAQ